MTASPVTCSYRHDYHNFKNNKIQEFVCNEESLGSGLCKFHDKDYCNQNESEISELIIKKIDESIEYKIQLICVGYFIPSLNIEEKRFPNVISFVDATFLHEVIFDNCTFVNVDFTESIFDSDASFRNTIFEGKTDFSKVKIGGDASFRFSKFKSNTTFSSGEFKTCSFFGSEFNEVDFSDCTFNELVNFSSSKFHSKTIFIGTHFRNEANFSLSKFVSEGSFIGTIFTKNAHFRNVQFSQQPDIKFDCDLSWVSFIETDITRIRFGNKIQWNNRNSNKNKEIKKSKIGNSSYKIYDEWLIEKEQDPELQLETVMDVYRNLRENYDFSLRYEIAGEFFVREMDLKRKYQNNLNPKGKSTILKNRIIRTIGMYAVYNLISQYGHSLSRPILCSLPFLVVGTMAFLTADFTKSDIPHNFHLNGPIVTAILRSLSGFIPIYTMTNKLEFTDVVLKIILLPIAGTFFLALKRKLERQFRH